MVILSYLIILRMFTFAKRLFTHTHIFRLQDLYTSEYHNHVRREEVWNASAPGWESCRFFFTSSDPEPDTQVSDMVSDIIWKYIYIYIHNTV